jgi:Zn-finger nucleic acid-binding protein
MRDAFATCPRCQTALDPRGDRAVCGACQGLLIGEARLSQMIADLLGDQVSDRGWSGKVAVPEPLPLEERAARSDQVLTCPRCAAAMETKRLHEIAIDRCAAHGLWFDRDELEQALQRAAAAGRMGATTGEKTLLALTFAAVLAAELIGLIAM